MLGPAVSKMPDCCTYTRIWPEDVKNYGEDQAENSGPGDFFLVLNEMIPHVEEDHVRFPRMNNCTQLHNLFSRDRGFT